MFDGGDDDECDGDSHNTTRFAAPACERHPRRNPGFVTRQLKLRLFASLPAFPDSLQRQAAPKSFRMTRAERMVTKLC
jgi:hypothetical protein